MVDVSAGAVGEERDGRRAVVIGHASGEGARIIGGNAVAPDGVGMQREIQVDRAGRDQARRVVRRFDQQDGQLGIGDAGRKHDVGVAFARIPGNRTVPHEEAAIEGQVVAACAGGGQDDVGADGEGPLHALGDEGRK